MSRLLVLSPAFHGIWRGISAAFERRGHDVHTHLFDHNDTWAERAGYKLRHELPRYVGVDPRPRHQRVVTSGAVRALREHRPEAVLVVKGELLTSDFWDALDHSRARRLLWLYDDCRRIDFPDGLLARAGTVASFSDSDVARLEALGVDAHYLPLAFDTDVTSGRAPHAGEVVFAGARYPQREDLLARLLAAGVPVRAYGRQWSHHPTDRLRTWDPRRPGVPSGRELSRDDLYAVLAEAPAAVNVHDGTQDGFNLRTFEASGVGGVQVTDRPDVDRFYDVGTEVAVYRSPEELVELTQRALRDRPWAEAVRAAGRRRTLADHTMDHRVAQLEAWWA